MGCIYNYIYTSWTAKSNSEALLTHYAESRLLKNDYHYNVLNQLTPEEYVFILINHCPGFFCIVLENYKNVAFMLKVKSFVWKVWVLCYGTGINVDCKILFHFKTKCMFTWRTFHSQFMKKVSFRLIVIRMINSFLIFTNSFKITKISEANFTIRFCPRLSIKNFGSTNILMDKHEQTWTKNWFCLFIVHFVASMVQKNRDVPSRITRNSRFIVQLDFHKTLIELRWI